MPNVQRGYQAIFPPSQAKMEMYYTNGYEDATR